MDIKEATIHQLSKAVQTRGDTSVTRHVRTSPLPIDDTLQTISKELLAMYATRSNSTGTFGADPTLHQFPVALTQYYEGTLPFFDFTIAALKLIEHEMAETRVRVHFPGFGRAKQSTLLRGFAAYSGVRQSKQKGLSSFSRYSRARALGLSPSSRSAAAAATGTHVRGDLDGAKKKAGSRPPSSADIYRSGRRASCPCRAAGSSPRLPPPPRNPRCLRRWSICPWPGSSAAGRCFPAGRAPARA